MKHEKLLGAPDPTDAARRAGEAMLTLVLLVAKLGYSFDLQFSESDGLWTLELHSVGEEPWRAKKISGLLQVLEDAIAELRRRGGTW